MKYLLDISNQLKEFIGDSFHQEMEAYKIDSIKREKTIVKDYQKLDMIIETISDSIIHVYIQYLKKDSKVISYIEIKEEYTHLDDIILSKHFVYNPYLPLNKRISNHIIQVFDNKNIYQESITRCGEAVRVDFSNFEPTEYRIRKMDPETFYDNYGKILCKLKK